MANILVLAETSGDSVKSVTFEILGKLDGHNVDVAIVGDMGANAVAEVAKYGAANVHNIKGDNLDKYSPEGYANALKEFIGDKYELVFAGATSLAKDLVPRLSGMFDSGMASEVTNFVMDGDNFSGTRPLFAGKVLAKVELQGPKPGFVTVRPNALGMPDSPTAGAGAANEVSGNAGDPRRTLLQSSKEFLYETLELLLRMDLM